MSSDSNYTVRKQVLAGILEDWKNTSALSDEARGYLMETKVIPTLIFALEDLLVGRAEDRPSIAEEDFNPIRWLAQCLFRFNITETLESETHQLFRQLGLEISEVARKDLERKVAEMQLLEDLNKASLSMRTLKPLDSDYANAQSVTLRTDIGQESNDLIDSYYDRPDIQEHDEEVQQVIEPASTIAADEEDLQLAAKDLTDSKDAQVLISNLQILSQFSNDPRVTVEQYAKFAIDNVSRTYPNIQQLSLLKVVASDDGSVDLKSMTSNLNDHIGITFSSDIQDSEMLHKILESKKTFVGQDVAEAGKHKTSVPVVMNDECVAVLKYETEKFRDSSITRQNSAIEQYASQISKDIETIEFREGAVGLAVSSAQWMNTLGHKAEFYVVTEHSDPSKNQVWSGEKIMKSQSEYRKVDTSFTQQEDNTVDDEFAALDDQNESFEDTVSVTRPRTGRPKTATLTPDRDEDLQPSSIIPIQLQDLVISNKVDSPKLVPEMGKGRQDIYEHHSPDGNFNISIPIHQKNGKLVAVVVIKEDNEVVSTGSEALAAKKSRRESMVRDAKNVAEVLKRGSSALGRSYKPMLSRQSTAGSRRYSARSQVPEFGTGHELMFPAMMFESVKKRISTIDARVIAELRSYKHPPKVVYAVLKSIMYILGFQASELKKWADISKHLDMDILKRMSKYEPMTKQKKKIFRRINILLSRLPSIVAIRDQSSEPTDNMFQWLQLCIELRRYGVKVRSTQSLAGTMGNLTDFQGSMVFLSELNDDKTPLPKSLTSKPNGMNQT